jgi:4-hydroxybenzoate-CoA ligase/benzoate-CoA ligase
VPDLATPTYEVPRSFNASEHFIARHVREGRGDKIAYIHDAGTTTYAELADRTARFASALRAHGIEPEQRVALVMHDTPDFVAAFFGCLRAGVIPIPLNTLLTEGDYEYLIADSRAKAVFVSDALVAKVPSTTPRFVTSKLDDFIADAPPMAEAFSSTCDDVAFWLYSSGSTGRPKGALHLHSHLLHTARLYGENVLGMREDDVVFSAAKLFFAYGLGNAMTFPLLAGATAVLLAERPTPASVMRVLETHHPTIFCGVPTLFASILADAATAQSKGSPRLRASISAGEALPEHTGLRWRERFGTDILDGIGSTEMLHIFISNRHGDVKYGSSGKPVPGYEVKLEEETLWVKGPSSCTAYWNQREKSLATFHGPWTCTGDRYTCDENGYYTYSGRADDMLKVGGIWVSPFEVESALSQHEAVFEAAVVGHADEEGLIKPRAFVVLKPGHAGGPDLAAELKTFVKSKIAPYKYPRWIEFVDSLPKTATGKIQRFKLRAS